MLARQAFKRSASDFLQDACVSKTCDTGPEQKEEEKEEGQREEEGGEAEEEEEVET